MRIEVIDRADATDRARPAATVVLVRDSPGGIEVLMIKRGSKTAFAGMWAFPGGVIEDDDIPDGTEPDPMPAARAAAVREAHEEVGLVIDESSLVFWSHWLPPIDAPRRFSTWFFVARGEEHHGDHAVDIDGDEVHEHRWVGPSDALALHASGEVELAPPTFVTLTELARHTETAEALAAADPIFFATELKSDAAGNRLCVWVEDVGYGATGDVDAAGPRHRIVMAHDGAWSYLRTF